jgi:3-oxoacyl-[acyl-carrier-protein] synthase II
MTRPDDERVVVTGVGVCCAHGDEPEALWSAALDRRSRTTTLEVEGFPTFLVSPVPDESIEPHLDRKQRRYLDRVSMLASLAAGRAVADAGGLDHAEPPDRGVVVGAGIAGIQTMDAALAKVYEHGAVGGSPLAVPMGMPNAAAAQVALQHEARGPCLTVATACAGGAQAIANGASLVRRGEAEVVLAGGAEAAINKFILLGFNKMGAMSRRLDDPEAASRPFDVDRDGFVLSEGSAFLVLERFDRARARGATVRGEVLGWAQTSDAFHIVAPDPEGASAAECIRRALRDAALEPGEVASINAHGTSTKLNDVAEAKAIVANFGREGPPVTATKGFTGHALAASGALEAVLSIWSANEATVPPTANVAEVDPEIDVDVVIDAPRSVGPGPVVSSSFGFGGQNCVLVLGGAA